MMESAMDNDSVCHNWIEKLRRILHWGPVIVLPIIFFISFVTLTWTVDVLPPSTSLQGLFQLLFLIGMLYTILRSYFCSLFMGPGFVPLKWMPSDRSAEGKLQFCRICCGYKPPRAHHCRSCKRCVMKMDHHCPWINTCCGHLNHCHFIVFTASASIGCFGCTLILGPVVYRTFRELPYAFFYGSTSLASSLRGLIVITFAFGLAIGVTLSVGTLSFYQLLALRKNETAIESWIVEKANYRRNASTLKPFVYPYDLGSWNNICQVLTWSGEAVGDGIHWPVRQGCGQYDLTIEQIRQKKIKMLLRREYRVVIGYNGRLYPFLQFGCCTAYHAPYPNEQRLLVQPGDMVLITRWSRYWLYGDLKPNAVFSSSTTNGFAARHTEAPRGWLPRRCVIESFGDSRNEDDSKLS